MSFSVGIVGLPNVGKSTLFKVLTKKSVEISPRPFTTISPNLGQVAVPDERLEKIAEVVHPEKITHTNIEFVDIAGLVKGAYKGEGLGNQFLAHIRNCDAILLVLRGFEAPEIENVLGEINPQKEFEVLKTELLMKDLETIEKTIQKLHPQKEIKKIALLEKIKESVLREKLLNEIELSEEEKKNIQDYRFLTEKPMFAILNTDGKRNLLISGVSYLQINLKEEEEFLELSEEERKEFGFTSKIKEIITSCYRILNLITFFTIAGGKETKAWTIKEKSPILEAAEKVHSDFAKRFIKGEVLFWEDLIKVGSWQRAKELGLIKVVGKEHIVQDGEIIEFRI